MSPLELLILTLAVTAAAGGWHYLTRYQERQLLRKLAREVGMNFAPGDRFRLTGRVRDRFPVPGAANLRVGDVLYGSSGQRHRYLFTVHYTQGVLRTKHRCRRVGGVIESSDRRSEAIAFLLAADQPNILDQYRSLNSAMAEESRETSEAMAL